MIQTNFMSMKTSSTIPHASLHPQNLFYFPDKLSETHRGWLFGQPLWSTQEITPF